MKTLYSIQYLRALAAAAVVCFHASARAGVAFTVGEAGVDLFFVLSGFLMIAITNAETRPLAFLNDRAKRIVPLYWLATTVFLFGTVLHLFPGARLETWHVVSSYLFLPSRMPGAEAIWPLLVPGWTLNFEMFFYVLFACSLLMTHRLQLVALTLALVMLVVLGALFQPHAAAAIFYTQPILLEFVAGAWLGAWWKRHGPPPGGWSTVGAALLLYLVAWRVGSDSARVVMFGLPALLLFAGVLRVEHSDGSFPKWNWLKMAGDASYSIYLWHTLILSVSTKIAVLARWPRPAIVAFGVIAGVGGGVVAYHLIERPILTWFKRRRTRPGRPVSNM